MTRRKWTDAETGLLIERYPHLPTAELAAELGRPIEHVYRKAAALGLKKTPDFLASGWAGRLDGVCGLPTRFRPGQAAWNKGMKGWQAGGRSAETRFKKGTRNGRAAQLWQPIGSERVTKEGYLQRKLTDTGCTRRDYVNVHWIVWREAGREIPPGHALVFRDGNKRNFALDNLELVTRQDLMRRNSVHNYGPEIAQAVQLKGAITRQINKRKTT